MNGLFRKIFYFAALFLLSGFLISCGGSSDPSGDLPVNQFSSQPQAGVVALTAAQTSKVVQVAPVESATSEITDSVNVKFDADMTNVVASGQVVAIPQDESKGFPLGYTGKVVASQVSNGATTLTLAPASLTDVYKTLSINYDSSRGGVRVVGVVGPSGSFSQTPDAKVTQAGLKFPGVDLKATLDEYGVKFNLDVPFEVPISDDDDSPTMYINLKANDLSIKQETEVVSVEVPPDPNCLTGRAGCTEPMARGYSRPVVSKNNLAVTGNLSASFGIKSDATVKSLDKAKSYKLLARKMHGRSKIKWDDLDRSFLGFKLSGLDDADKDGLIPLGGVVVAPSYAGSFKGENVPGFDALKNLSIIIWFYLGLDGEVKVAGDINFLRVDIPLDMNFGFSDVTASGEAEDASGYEKKEITVKTGIKASGELSGSASMTAAVDVFTGGIRPIAVKFNAIEWAPSLVLSAEDAEIQYWPLIANPFSGDLCFRVNHSLVSGRTTVLADIELGKKSKSKKWNSVSKDGKGTVASGLAFEAEFGGYDWLAGKSLNVGEDASKKDFMYPRCIFSKQTDFQASVEYDIDSFNPAKKYYKIDIGRSGSFIKDNVDELKVVDSWAEGVDSIVVPIEPGTTIGVLALQTGVSHALAITASSSKYGGELADVKPITVKVDVPKRFTVQLKALNTTSVNCKDVNIEAVTSDVPVAASPLAYKWTVLQGGVAIVNDQVGSSGSIKFSLPSCDSTVVKVKIDGKDTSTATSQLTFEPSSLIAKVVAVSPMSASIGTATTFTITGQNLPLTPTMTIGGIPCQIQSSPAPTASGFTTVCTPGGAVGNQIVGVKTAVGGVIDESRTINVISSSRIPLTAKLNPVNGRYYELINCGDWSTCRDAAIARGGRLVTIRSKAENDWLAQNILSNAVNSSGAWIGLTDEGSEGQWRWISGEPVSYTNWNVGEPNNAGGIVGENYAHMYTEIFVWNDLINNNSMIVQAIVEYIEGN